MTDSPARTHTPQLFPARAGAPLLAALLLLFTSCAAPSTSSSIDASADSAPTSSKDQPAAPPADDPFALQAAALQAALADPGRPPETTDTLPDSAAALPPRPRNPAPTPEPARDAAAISTPAEPPPAPVVDTSLPEPTDPATEAARRRAALVVELSAMLRDDQRTGDPVRDAVPLLAMELVQPGSIEADYREILDELSAPERLVLESVRMLIADLHAGDALCDGARFGSLLRERARPLGPAEPLRIGAMHLCSRVEGFGRFEPFAGDRLLAGRAHPAILYCEVANFAQKPDATENSAASVVELSQSARLFTAGDNTEVVRWKDESVRDVSRSQRRDFYLARRIDVPANLGVGRYNLKVTVRDLTSGSTAESIMTFEVVADPKLVRSQ